MNKAQHALVASISIALLTLGACKKEEAPAAPAAAAPAPAAAAPPPPPPSAEQMAQAAEERSNTLEADDTTWSPEAMEELLAPIALYPDTVLEQVLVASTNPQEVLDAGNWLFDNPTLKGKALDQAAEAKGFTPPVLALVQFPETVDMLCQEMPWTTELGQAYVNDQAGVMEAVQRLRRQASDIGNLKSSPQMTVSTQTVDKVQYVTVSPPSPEVIYVPQYDPVAAYAPLPPAPAAAPTTTTVVQEGHSDGAMVTTAIFAFGAGMLVNEIFDDDDDYCNRYSYSYNCHGGSYWGRPPVYYPPYPYRPNYGNGFYPSYGYNRPGYNNDSFNNNNVNININGNNNDYWNRYDNNNYNGNRRSEARSPISQANPKRNDLNDLNRQTAKGPKRPAPTKGPEFNDRDSYKAARPADRTASTRNSITGKPGAAKDGKVQGSYKGAKPNNDKMAAGKSAGAAASRDLPKVQGSYAGSKDKSAPQNRDMAANKSARPKPDKSNAQRPQPSNKGGADRGYADANRDRAQADKSMPNKAAQDRQQQDRQAQNRQQQDRQQQDRQAQNRQQNQQRSSAVSGSSRGGNDARAASQRGKQSMPQGARSKQPANKKQR